jgi:gamma-glutamylcyclotransferase (GGCT)/AIG2-like uncharacterized protein YtfP
MDHRKMQALEQEACRKGNSRPVFVCGTLMRGQRANHLMSGSDFAGCFCLKDYAMYHLGSYPGIVPCAGESVMGELYFVSEEMIAQMDRYEREGDLYLRRSVTLTAGENTHTAEVYVYNRDVSGFEKMRKAWNASDEDLTKAQTEMT